MKTSAWSWLCRWISSSVAHKPYGSGTSKRRFYPRFCHTVLALQRSSESGRPLVIGLRCCSKYLWGFWFAPLLVSILCSFDDTYNYQSRTCCCCHFLGRLDDDVAVAPSSRSRWRWRQWSWEREKIYFNKKKKFKKKRF